MKGLLPHIGQLVSPGSASFRGSPGNPLTNGVQAYYSFDEASGTRQDGLSRGPGPAAFLTRANSERLVHADDPLYEIGNTNRTFGVWVFLDALTDLQTAFGKALGTGNQREYRLTYRSAANQWNWITFSDGGSANASIAVVGSSGIGAWQFLIVEHDADNDKIRIRSNGGSPVETAFSGGVFAGTAGFSIGSDNSAGTNPFGGRIGPTFMANAILTNDEIQTLYGGGRPQLYEHLPEPLQAKMIAYYNLNEFSTGAGAISRLDSTANALTLTDTNTVPSIEGIGLSLSDVNTVGSVAGVVNNAAEFVIANSEQLVGGAIHRSSDTDWSFHGLAYLAAKATDQTVFAKRTGAGTTEYEEYYDTSSDVWRWTVYDGTNAIGTVDALELGAVDVETWYWLYVWHSATDNEVGIRTGIVGTGVLNDADVAATTGAASAGTAGVFRFGANGTGAPQLLGGRLDEWFRHSRLLTDDEQEEAFEAAVAGRTWPWAA